MYEKQGMDPTEASKKAKEEMRRTKAMTKNITTYNYSSAKEKQAELSESVRKEKEAKWNENHANDGTKELLWLLIPGALIALACVFFFWRENKIKKYDKEVLAPYREKVGEISDEILKNEDSTNRQKFQLHKLYKEMKELFERADFVKFAKYVAPKDDNASVLPQAVRFITETYQAEIEAEEESQAQKKEE